MNKRRCFALIELLVVVAIITILLMILLPAIGSARSLGRQSVCAANLRSLGQTHEFYTATYNDWIAGSPNTSGNGANPGGNRLLLSDGSYYDWDPARDAWPAVHIFDWANPLLMMLQPDLPRPVPERYDQSKKWVLKCPDNQWSAYLNHASRISIETIVSSYLTSRFFTYVPAGRKTGSAPGTFFWSDDFVPESYLPRLERIENPSWKVFLADGCRVDRGNPRAISNADYGYTERGAWVNISDPENGPVSLSYRFEAAREQAYRHRRGINLLAFDGHVEHQPEGSSETNNGFGSGSRQARFWFPTGTDTGKLPSASSFSNRKILVP